MIERRGDHGDHTSQKHKWGDGPILYSLYDNGRSREYSEGSTADTFWQGMDELSGMSCQCMALSPCSELISPRHGGPLPVRPPYLIRPFLPPQVFVVNAKAWTLLTRRTSLRYAESQEQKQVRSMGTLTSYCGTQVEMADFEMPHLLIP